MGSGVLGFRVSGLGLWGLGLRVEYGFDVRVWGFGVWGFGVLGA